MTTFKFIERDARIEKQGGNLKSLLVTNTYFVVNLTYINSSITKKPRHGTLYYKCTFTNMAKSAYCRKMSK